MLVKLLLKLLHKESYARRNFSAFITLSAHDVMLLDCTVLVLNSIRDVRCIFVQDDSVALFGLRISIAASRTM